MPPGRRARGPLDSPPLSWGALDPPCSRALAGLVVSRGRCTTSHLITPLSAPISEIMGEILHLRRAVSWPTSSSDLRYQDGVRLRHHQAHRATGAARPASKCCPARGAGARTAASQNQGPCHRSTNSCADDPIAHDSKPDSRTDTATDDPHTDTATDTNAHLLADALANDLYYVVPLGSAQRFQ